MRNLLQVGGIGGLGSIGLGTPHPIEGAFRNVETYTGALGTAGVDFDYENSDVNSNLFRFVLYLNGLPMAEGTADNGFVTAPLGSSAAEVQLLILRENEDIPDHIFDEYGRRVVLTWTASSDTDTVQYNIYYDNKTGTVDTATALDTITEIETESVYIEGPTTGTGSGRVTINGTFTGDAENKTWRVEITGSGKMQFSTGDGLNGTDITFTRGSTVTLADGLSVAFEDAITDYDTGDQFDFQVGPLTLWVSDELTPGAYKFQVGAQDAAGNEGTLSAELSQTIDPAPEPPTNISVSYDGGTRGVSATWTDPTDSDLASIKIYSNFNPDTETFDTYVWEHLPIATIAAGTEAWSYTLPGSAEGELLLYFRAVDSDGFEDDNIDLQRVQAVATAESTVAPPFDLIATPGAAGVVQLDWFFDTNEGAIASFNVYQFNSTPDAAAWAAASPIANVLNTETGVGSATYTTGALSGTKYFAIKSVDGSGLLSEESNIASATADSTAPGQVTGERGVVV